MNIRHLFAVIVFSMLLFTCDSDDDNNDYPNLSIYVTRFTEEARARGWNIDPSIVEAVYVDIIRQDSKTYCGYGWPDYNGTGKRRIEISRACQWAELSDDDREIFVFHELGHAILNRGHDYQMDCNGEMISIMNPSLPHYKLSDAAKRKYYIDELFDEMAARDKCIDYGQDFNVNPQFYKYSSTDDEWVFYSSNGRYTGTLDESPVISSSDNTTSETGYWFRQFTSPGIPNCAKVSLRVKVNSTGLVGKGAVIAVRVYENEITETGAIAKQTQVLTTEDHTVSGVLNNHVEELTVPCLSMKTSYLIIFCVMMPGTTGQVSFDDIQLLVDE